MHRDHSMHTYAQADQEHDAPYIFQRSPIRLYSRFVMEYILIFPLANLVSWSSRLWTSRLLHIYNNFCGWQHDTRTIKQYNKTNSVILVL